MLTGKSSISASGVILDSEESELLKGFRELSDDDKEELLCLLHLKLRKLQKARGTNSKSSVLTDTEKGSMVG